MLHSVTRSSGAKVESPGSCVQGVHKPVDMAVCEPTSLKLWDKCSGNVCMFQTCLEQDPKCQNSIAPAWGETLGTVHPAVSFHSSENETQSDKARPQASQSVAKPLAQGCLGACPGLASPWAPRYRFVAEHLTSSRGSKPDIQNPGWG